MNFCFASIWSCIFPKAMLFGGDWHVNDWRTVDDRIRGGSSKSVLEQKDDGSVVFRGELDTTTLGGAGFASQVYYYQDRIDLSKFKGICVAFGEFDDEKMLAINLFNHLPKDRGDGRNASGITYKAVLKPFSSGSVFIPFSDFKHEAPFFLHCSSMIGAALLWIVILVFTNRLYKSETTQ